MNTTGIARAARTATFAVLARAAALGLATGIAQAAPATPGQAGPAGGVYGNPGAAQSTPSTVYSHRPAARRRAHPAASA
ncbi:MAG TPA: hypothetical protein VLZ05_16810 [Mycobacterium sp.]|nr:hypothetical protein [Mycobacterium sp.]HUH70367.1 hypothetical protein [Mycobacterium sp.]